MAAAVIPSPAEREVASANVCEIPCGVLRSALRVDVLPLTERTLDGSGSEAASEWWIEYPVVEWG